MLVRDLRKWDVTALVINTVIGAGIFGLPSAAFALLGAYSLVAYLVSAIAIFFIILCFAEVASRFSTTGGPYVYARAAFGPLVAFEVGWLMWLSRCTAFAALCNLLVDYLDYFVPGIGSGVWRAVASVAITGAITFVNVIGVRSSARVTNTLTIGKLIPLVLVAGAGMFFVDTHRFTFTSVPPYSSFSQAALLLAFAYMGFEGAVIPSGEVRDPARHLVFGLLVGFAVIVVVYLALQLVCIGLVRDLAHSQRPLADAAVQALGPPGASLVALGAVLAIAGTLNSITFATSRLLLPMSEQGQLPALFGRIHPNYRTPAAAILFTAAVALMMTLLSTFLSALTISTVTRLTAYAITCGAVPVLRRRGRAPFHLPAGTAIAAAAIIFTLWLLSGSSWAEIRVVAAALVVGLALYSFGGTAMVYRDVRTEV